MPYPPSKAKSESTLLKDKGRWAGTRLEWIRASPRIAKDSETHPKGRVYPQVIWLWKTPFDAISMQVGEITRPDALPLIVYISCAWWCGTFIIVVWDSYDTRSHGHDLSSWHARTVSCSSFQWLSCGAFSRSDSPGMLLVLLSSWNALNPLVFTSRHA